MTDITLETSVVVGEDEYAISVESNVVSISKNNVNVGSDGVWNGYRVEDCPADLGEEVWDMIDMAIMDAED